MAETVPELKIEFKPKTGPEPREIQEEKNRYVRKEPR
jgi:hypothetical protein